MICTFCHKEIPENAVFCPECGMTVEKDEFQLKEKPRLSGKKIALIWSAAFLCLLIIGGGLLFNAFRLPEIESLKYVCDYDDGLLMTVTAQSRGGRVYSTVQTYEYDLSYYTDNEIEEIKAGYDEIIETGKDFESFECTYEVNDDALVATYTINDLNDTEALKEYNSLGLLDIDWIESDSFGRLSMEAYEEELYKEGFILYNGDEPDLSDLDQAIFVWSDAKTTSVIVLHYRYDITYKREQHISADARTWSSDYKLKWLQAERDHAESGKNLQLYDYEEIITDNRLYTKHTIDGLYDVQNVIACQYSGLLNINGFDYDEEFNSYLSVAKTSNSLEKLGYVRNDDFDLNSVLPDEKRDVVEDEPPYLDYTVFKEVQSTGWTEVATYGHYGDIVYTVKETWSKNCSGWSNADFESARRYFADRYEPIEDYYWFEVAETIEDGVFTIEMTFTDLHVPENAKIAAQTSWIGMGSDFRRISLDTTKDWLAGYGLEIVE